MVEHLEVFVEEPSMEAALREILPKLLGRKVSFEVYQFQCKNEMLQRLPQRLSGYRSWLPETWRIVVVLDCDRDDCHKLKNQLEQFARRYALTTKTSPGKDSWQVVNRLAIEELEAWFFGDMDAVRTVYPRVSSTLERQARYQDPDAIQGGTWETFERVLQGAGYFKGGLRKIQAARDIAPHMNPMRNRSRSFKVFCDVMLEMGKESNEEEI